MMPETKVSVGWAFAGKRVFLRFTQDAYKVHLFTGNISLLEAKELLINLQDAIQSVSVDDPDTPVSNTIRRPAPNSCEVNDEEGDTQMGVEDDPNFHFDGEDTK